MIFIPDISKQAQEVVISRRSDKANHMPLTFNAIPVTQTSHQKHIQSFTKYLRTNSNLSDCNKTQIHNHLVCKRTLNHLVKLAQ